MIISRRWMTPAILAMLILTPMVFAKGGKETVANGKVGKQIARWVQSAEQAGFSGVVFAARKGKVVTAIGVGSADLNGKVRNSPATLFEIASATKQFTGAAAAHLAERGKIDLDASISEYLPGVPDDCKGITVRHLLHHTSGIPGSNADGSGTDLGEVLPTFLRGGPKHEPGTHWEYWNQGYSLASEIIARASGKSYMEYCQEALFKPAGMKTARFTGDAPPKKTVVAVGRSRRGKPRSALDHPYGSYGFQYRGMGGAVTSAWDLWSWHIALSGKKVLGPKGKQELFRTGLNDYALGWTVKTERGRLVHTHTGGVRGFICSVSRYPEENAAIFVLCNDDSAPMHDVARGVEQMLFGEKLTVVLPTPIPERMARQLVGTYQDSRGNKLTLEQKDKLVTGSLVWSGGQRSRMTLSEASGKLRISDGHRDYELTVGESKKTKNGAQAPWISYNGQRFERQ